MNATHLATAARIADYIPVVSTVTNLIALFQKFYYRHAEPSTSPYYTYIQDKTYFECAVLLVPVLGNLLVVLTINNPKFMKSYIDEGDLRFLGSRLKNDKQFLKTLFQEHRDPFFVTCLKYTSLKNDREFIKDCLRTCLFEDNKIQSNIRAGALMAQIGRALKEDTEFVYECFEINDMVLEFADDSLQKNASFIARCARKDFRAMAHAAPELQNDETLMEARAKENIEVLLYAGESLRKHEAFMKRCATENLLALLYADPSLRKSPTFMQEMIAVNPLAVAFIDRALQKNKIFVTNIPITAEQRRILFLEENPALEAMLVTTEAFHEMSAQHEGANIHSWAQYQELRRKVMEAFNALQGVLSA